MAKAIYQRYECVATPVIQYVAEIKSINTDESLPNSFMLYLSYSLNESTGAFSTYNSKAANQFIYGEKPFYRLYTSQRLHVYSFKSYNSDTDWVSGHGYHEITAKQTTVYSYSRGTYLNDIIADYGSLPADGRHTDGYWYVFVKMASDLKVNVSGLWRDTPTGFTNINGIWKPQSEFKANVNGIYK